MALFVMSKVSLTDVVSWDMAEVTPRKTKRSGKRNFGTYPGGGKSIITKAYVDKNPGKYTKKNEKADG